MKATKERRLGGFRGGRQQGQRNDEGGDDFDKRANCGDNAGGSGVGAGGQQQLTEAGYGDQGVEAPND